MCDGVAAYRTSLCQSPAIWSRIKAISSPGTATNTSDKSKRRQFVGLIYKLTKFVTRACRPEAEQWSRKADKLTSRSANGRMLQRRALIDHLPSATRHKGVIGHCVLLEGGGLPRSPSAPRALLGVSARSSAKPSHNTCGLPPTNTFRPLAPILSNLARNSPAAPSNIEFASLELQRFPAVSKNYRLKLCAKFVWTRPRASNPARALWILRRPPGQGA